jgi:hypothetical protein
MIGAMTAGSVYALLGAACLYGLSHYRSLREMLHEYAGPLLRRFGGLTRT